MILVVKRRVCVCALYDGKDVYVGMAGVGGRGGTHDSAGHGR